MENTPKQYLYRMVPQKLEGEDLHPLNILKEKGVTNPKMLDLYESILKNYTGNREYIPNIPIPNLENAKWSDVIQLSPIHPEDLMKALNEAGFDFVNKKFYQIDPDLLDPKNTTIYLNDNNFYNDEPENYTEFNPEKLKKISVIKQKLIDYYKEHKMTDPKSHLPFLYAHVPHIFHKGSIENITDISKFPVIEVTGYAKTNKDEK